MSGTISPEWVAQLPPEYAEEAANTLSWRYHLEKNQVQSWLNETEWNYNMELDKPLFHEVISMLSDLDLVSEESSKKAFQILFEKEI